MLGVMRKNAGSWVVKLILGALALAFALSFGFTSYYSQTEDAIKVNGEVITTNQVDYEAYTLMENYRNQFGPEVARMITQQQVTEQAQARLIGQALLRQAAAEMGIITTEEELLPYIQSIPYFQKEGVFDFETYRAVLASQRMTPEAFEADMRRNLTEDKLRTLINSSVFVTESELEKFIATMYTKVEGAYLLFQTKDFLNKVVLSDEEKQTYFREHAAEFMEPARISFTYLNFTDASFRQQMSPTESELQHAYEINYQRFVEPEALSVRSIDLILPPRADEKMWQQTKERADSILKEVKAENSDFVALAKQYDQNPVSRMGNIWRIVGEDLDPKIREQLFATEVGQAAILEIPQGFMIIKVEEHHAARVKPLEEVKALLEAELQVSLARRAVEKAANQVLLDLRQGKSLEEAAAIFSLKPEKIELAALGDNLPPELPTLEQIWDTLQGLSAGQAGLPLSYAGGVVLPVLTERMDAKQKTFEQVEAQVTEALSKRKALDLALAAAQEAITELKGAAKPAEAMLAKNGAKRFAPLLPNQEVSDLPGSAGMLEALFNTTVANPVVSGPVPVLDGVAVAVLLDRVLPSAEDIEERKLQERDTLLKIKQDDAFMLFMRDQQAKASIEVLR